MTRSVLPPRRPSGRVLPRLDRRVAALLVLLPALAAGCARGPTRVAEADDRDATAPDSFEVAFHTTKGDFVVRAHRDWAPLGADRFYTLLRRNWYDTVPVFRVVPGYVAQLGVRGDSAADRSWRERGLPDEASTQGNTRGRIAFARGGPATRSTQIFINLGNNSPRLDTLTVSGVAGYPPVAEVVSGMEVVDAFEARWRDQPSAYQDSLRVHGRAWLDQRFPGLDYILTARVGRRW